ncbi:aminoglycoside phosphotransferase family protein [Ureibacillus chungkukjangi]|uniref:hypothetical protein n=1 Tax=Ureibacillus chungkukjangi TaxID=1202712 RepID=UPI00384F785A
MKICMIPSAKLVNYELQSLFGAIPSLLLPYKEGTVLDFLFQKYNPVVDKVVLLVHEGKEKLLDYVKQKNLAVEICYVDQIVNLGYSIEFGLDYLNRNYDLRKIEKLIINFGDTIVDDALIDLDIDNVFFYAVTDDCSRWTTFNFRSDCELQIVEKEYNESLNKYNTFVGLYVFSNSTLLLQLLKNFNSSDMDNFHHGLKEYNNSLPLKIIETKNWHDVGHIDMYNDAQSDVKERYFNSISIDKRRGILTKKSEHKKKFINEIQWYLKIPKDLQYICPRIFDYSLDFNNPFVSMEYYGYSTLHDLFIYGDVDADLWKKIFLSLISVLEDMGNYRLNLSKQEIHSSLFEMYVAKTIERLTELKESNFSIDFNQPIIINNKKYNSLNYYVEHLPDFLDYCNLKNIDYFTIIHGDFCLSNILYEKNSKVIRLIDPRGTFGSKDIYGDQRYDIAKLSHSIIGKYDLIIKDLFILDTVGNEINFSFYNIEKYKEIESIFLSVLKEYEFDYKQISFIQSLLFLSMIPLHSDYPKRQYAMLSTGITILDKVMERTLV